MPLGMGLSVRIFTHALIATLKLSAQALWRSHRGRLTHQLADRALQGWANQLLRRAQLSVSIDGLNNIPKDRPLIFISNHLSLYDIPVTYQVLPVSLRMAAKNSLFKFPIWGRALRIAGCVDIERSAPENARENLKKAGGEMKLNRVCLQISPEGTRSANGELKRFKRGAFELALATKYKVVPLLIEGTDRVLKKGSADVQLGKRVRLRVLPPLEPTDFEESRSFADYAHQIMAKGLQELRSTPED